MDLDRTLTGGLVVDGTGARAYRADVGIRRGRIEAIGDLAVAPAGERVDARGRVVCPGFIDMHSHSDLSLLLCPTGDSKIHQGVTTEVVGNCGFSPAPLTAEHAETVRSLHGFFGSFINDLDWRWRSYGEFAARLGAGGLGLNVAPLVGHVTVRASVMGYAQRPPSAAELGGMQDLVRSAMRDGCFGLSTGLVYPPGRLRRHRGSGRARPRGGRGRRRLREPHPRRGPLAAPRGRRGDRDRGAGRRPRADLAPQSGVPALLGPDPPRDAPVRVGPGAGPGRHVRRLSLHGGERAADPDRARLGARGGTGRAPRACPGAGHSGAARAGDRRAGPRVGPDPRGLDAGRTGQGRRGIVDRRHRRPPRDRSRRDAPRAPRGVGRARRSWSTSS